MIYENFEHAFILYSDADHFRCAYIVASEIKDPI